MKSPIQIICYINILLLIIIAFSCNTTEPPPPGNGEEPELLLKLEDVSCTEAWIKLTTTNLPLPAEIEIKKDTTITQTINLTTSDTLLYIDSLLPNNTYNLSVEISGIQYPASGIQFTTMDTTSHDFTFETFTFGEHSSSVLYDVTIIDENNIWAVGEIYMNDSLGQPDNKRYNAAIWNGNIWRIIRIPYNYKGTNFYHPIKSVFAFGQNDIWFCGNGVIHWDGTGFEPVPIPTNIWGPYQMNTLWGSSSSDLYVVGNNENIAHYNGSQWTKIESGTELNIGDIWGIADDNGGYNKYVAAANAMLKIDINNNLSRIDIEPGHSLSSVWGVSNRLIYTAGGHGLALYKNYQWEEMQSLNSVRFIRGTDYNNVFGLGSSASGSLLHFNGLNWLTFNTGINKVHFRVDMKNYLTVAVGWQGNQAAITLLKRN